MKLFRDYQPALKYGAKITTSDIANSGTLSFGTFYWVDGDSGADGNDGLTSSTAFATIAHAISAASAGDTILIKPRKMTGTSTDPVSYAETVILSKTLALVGLNNGRTQGGLPQIKIGAGSTAMITVRAPGCLITGLGINGASSTGGGVLLDDDGGATKSAFGTTISNCHFKNCVGSTATDASTGGAIMWSSAGNAWQVLIENNLFYKNVGDVVLKGTSGSVPQDVVIQNNTFQGTAATVDCHLYLAGGSGMSSVTVHNNVFADVLPALGSGANVRYAILTGCTGTFSNNFFAGSYTTTGFGATAAAAKIPTTVGLAHNYTDGGLVVRQ